MILWWRKDPLTEWEQRLITAVVAAHVAGTLRTNPSTVIIQQACLGNGGDYCSTIAAAILSLGGPHGPVVAVYDLLAQPDPGVEAQRMLDNGEKVPGWGNSFVKGEMDPRLNAAMDLLKQHPVYEKIQAVQKVMDAKNLYPNPGCVTAAADLALGIPRESAVWLGLQARIPVWTAIFQREVDSWRKS